MLKRFLAVGLFAAVAHAQTGVLPVTACTQYGVQAQTSGLKSTNFLQGIIPSCTVTVYLTGTTTIATTSPQSPFTANTNGSIPPISASLSQGYDVVLSGGIAPNTYPSPVTITDVFASFGSCAASPCPVINVGAPPYNADKTCTTDNQTIFQAAITAACSTGPPTPLYFPVGCYKTSTITNTCAASMIGEVPIGVNPPNNNAGSYIVGEPGEDVITWPEPLTASGPSPNPSWAMRDLVIGVDDSVDVSSTVGLYRYPGKWVTDMGCTSSSHVITSPHAEFTCGDVGQAIQLNGCGVGGANLVTTISSVVPCASQSNATPTVSVTAAASTTVTAGTGTAYISVAGLPVTQHIGNAALAFPCRDGNRSDYTMTGFPNNNVVELTNVKFYALSNSYQNSSASLFMQGCWTPYSMTATNAWSYGSIFGPWIGPSPINPYQGQAGQDNLVWNGGLLGASYPFIIYNGGGVSFAPQQIETGYSGYGPQFLQVGTTVSDPIGGYTIHGPEIESAASTNYGWRLEGAYYTFYGNLGGTNGGVVGPFWDANDSTCISCGLFGVPTINGSRNKFESITSSPSSPPINNGVGNHIAYRGENSSNLSATRSGNLNQTVIDQPVGTVTADSFRNGNAGLYPSDNDLLFCPDDFETGAPDDGVLDTADTTALCGKTFLFNSTVPSGLVGSFYSMRTLNGYGQAVIGTGVGTEVPATQVTVYVNAKCAASTSFTLNVLVIPSYTTVGTVSPTCGTSYQATAGKVAVNLSSYAGSDFAFDVTSGSNDAQVEYVAIRPYQADYNGYQPANAAGGTLTGPQTVPGMVNTTTPIRDETRQVLVANMTAVDTAGVNIGSTGSGNTTFSFPVTAANWYDMECKLPVTFVASATIAFELVSISGSSTISFVNSETMGNTAASAAFQDLFTSAGTSLAGSLTPTTGAPGGVTEQITYSAQFLSSHAGNIGIEFIGNGANNVQMLKGGECGITQTN